MGVKDIDVGLLRGAGELYAYLCDYEQRHKKPKAIKAFKLILLGGMSLSEKTIFLLSTIFKKQSIRTLEVRIKYDNAINMEKNRLLSKVFDCFCFRKFITLPYSEYNPNEVVRCFFSSCREIFYDNIYKLDMLTKDGDVIVDGGANIGLFSLFAKSLQKNTVCLAFEPEINNFKALERNIEDFDNIRIYNIGLSDVYSTGNILISDNILEHRLDSRFLDFDLNPHYYTKQTVKLDTLDNIVFSQKINKINLIKLDIEGSELSAIRGGFNAIKDFRPLLIVAVDHSDQESQKIISFFKDKFPWYMPIRLNKENLLLYCPELHSDRIDKLKAMNNG